MHVDPSRRGQLRLQACLRGSLHLDSWQVGDVAVWEVLVGALLATSDQPAG